ncbi:MAG: restriction endonuclease [Chloroflexi bacterium]|nr:restriction endonuclease [Chloroflexota bacterium]
MAILFFAAGGLNAKSSMTLFNLPFLTSHYNNLILFIVASLAAILAWGWAIHTIRAQDAAGKTIEELQALSPDAFEEWVAARFRDLGYSVKLAGMQGDHGVDLVAEKPGEIAVIQCKKYKSWSVGEPVLRDLFGAMHDFGAKQAYLVTTGQITRPAKSWADGKPIVIWDGDYLARLSLQMAHKGRPAKMDGLKPSSPDGSSMITAVLSNETPNPSISTAPMCPKCGSVLVERRNRSTGETFLGCPKYPACRYTQLLPKAIVNTPGPS